MNFIEGNVSSLVHLYLTEDSLLILDPPRKGLTNNIINCLLKYKPKYICYLSCNPATLARDMKLLTYENRLYNIELIQPIDFFPMTAHIECVVCLSLSNS